MQTWSSQNSCLAIDSSYNDNNTGFYRQRELFNNKEGKVGPGKARPPAAGWTARERVWPQNGSHSRCSLHNALQKANTGPDPAGPRSHVAAVDAAEAVVQ
eukprot:1158303-Pelagomonas_calceolata.AAC.8